MQLSKVIFTSRTTLYEMSMTSNLGHYIICVDVNLTAGPGLCCRGAMGSKLREAG